MQRGGQVSVEYLLVLGMAFLLLVPGGYLFYSFSQGSQEQVAGSQITRSGDLIINTVKEVYSVGENSWSTVNINFPSGVQNIYVTGGGNELVIEYDSATGTSEAVFFSNINMTTPYAGGEITAGEFKSGLTKIKVSSQGDYVQLREVR